MRWSESAPFAMALAAKFAFWFEKNETGECSNQTWLLLDLATWSPPLEKLMAPLLEKLPSVPTEIVKDRMPSWDIVILDDPDMPKLMPLESAKSIVPLVACWVPAVMAAIPAAAPGTTVAVMVFPSIPKLTPFELLKTTSPPVALVVPAEMLLMASKLAVTLEDPDIPNVTPLESEKTTVPVLTDWVPAEMPAPPPPAVALTSRLPPLMPTETIPWPTIVMLLASTVEEEDCPVVCEDAYQPTV